MHLVAVVAAAVGVNRRVKMSVFANINPFKAKMVDRKGADKEDIKKETKASSTHPHETGGCCGGCGGLEETDK